MLTINTGIVCLLALSFVDVPSETKPYGDRTGVVLKEIVGSPQYLSGKHTEALRCSYDDRMIMVSYGHRPATV